MTGAARVVVTGAGMVSAAGDGVETGWALLCAGGSALRDLTLFDTAPYGRPLAGEAAHRPRVPGVPRARQLLGPAADEALRSAGWTGPLGDTAVVLGTCQGEIEGARGVHRSFAARPVPEPSPLDRQAFQAYRPGDCSRWLAERVGADGPRSTVGMVCVSSAVALFHAAELIRAGATGRALVGGVEAFSAFVFTGFHCIGALATRELRPFDEDRDGTVLGEAAVLLCLERYDEAVARGAPILAEVLGGGLAADAVHMTAPDPDGGGLVRAIKQALAEAGLKPADIDYVNVHGTGTAFNDAMELQALQRVFGDAVPPISGDKAVFGHTLGAAGALDAVIAALAIRDQRLPPTVGLRHPVVDWDLLPGVARAPTRPLRTVLSTNSAFGGNNSAVILGAPR